jgi:SRSO17 transposase
MEWRQEPCPAPADLALETGQAWVRWLTEVERWLLPHLTRREARGRAWGSRRGLLRPVARHNGWQCAAVNGAATPSGVQPVLGRARWDAEAVREDVRASVVTPLGDPQAVVVREATGLRKQGPQAAGGARQERGTAGRMEHCHSGVLLAYASRHGQARLDGALSGAPAWPNDRARCARAGRPEKPPCAPQPPWARQRRQHAFDARVRAAWVPGESVYGDARWRRVWREEHARPQGLAVSGQAEVWRAGRPPQVTTRRATRAPAGGPRVRAGAGAPGPRGSDWAGLPLAAPWQPAGRRWLLVRRRRSAPTARPASGVCAPQATTVATVVPVAGSRWTVARCLAEATGEGGLEHEEGRRWPGWYRPSTLALGAAALLTVLRAVHLPTEEAPKKRCASLPRAAWQPARRREVCGSPACGGAARPLLAPCAGHPATRRAHASLVEVAPLAPRQRHILA